MRAGAVPSVLFLPLAVALGGAPAVGKTESAGLAARQVAQTGDGLVWCHDVDRSLVTRKPAWRCIGKVITEAEAKKIQLERVRRIRGLIKKPKPLFEGLNLRGTGSGFFVNANGAILTNWHVIAKCKGVSFTPAGGTALKTEVLAKERSKDLALLKTSFVSSNVASFRSLQPLGRTERVFVVGYPLHGKVTIKPILRSGHVVNARRGPRPDRFPMKIDVRRGNSGGPVLDRAGRVVGVVVAKINTPSVYAATGRLIRDVGIAIRLPVVLDFLGEQSVTIDEISTNPPLNQDDLFSKAQKFVGQVGCWR